MGLLAWLKGKTSERRGHVDARLLEWRRAWTAAAEQADEAVVGSLSARLDALGLEEEDVEIEREMLDGLRELVQMRVAVDANGLPVVETGHRVIGGERCYYSAPVSMPDDEAQPSGRLLLTGTRAVFIGGARTTSLPWHAVGDAHHDQRDVVLVRKNRESLFRFRCNNFADALRGAFLSRRLAATRQAAAPPAEKRS
jgi:hypothetical protein